jgi:single-strand DNA-binding protein
LRYREVEDEVEGTTFKHRIAEIHATSMKRLSKIETADGRAQERGWRRVKSDNWPQMGNSLNEETEPHCPIV